MEVRMRPRRRRRPRTCIKRKRWWFLAGRPGGGVAVGSCGGGGVACGATRASREKKRRQFPASGEDISFSLGSAWVERVFLQPGVTQMQFLCIHVGGTLAWFGFHGRQGSTPIPANPTLSKRSLKGIKSPTGQNPSQSSPIPINPFDSKKNGTRP
jgi:hypothetical protein